MKKAVIASVLIAVVAGAAIAVSPRVLGKKPETQNKKEVAAVAPLPRKDGKQAAPVAKKETQPAAPEASPEPVPDSPLKVRFDAPEAPELNKPVAVTLIVESAASAWPTGVEGEAALDLLLRLPVGIKLASGEGWTPAEIPPEEKEDSTGPWSVFEKRVPVQIPAGAPPERLAAEKVELTVNEEGINWIISSRARLIHGSNAWQAFGLLFATLQEGKGEFHETPKTPKDTQIAKAG